MRAQMSVVSMGTVRSADSSRAGRALVGKMVGRGKAPRQAIAERPFRRATAVERSHPLWHTPAARCSSSVVEHSLGKGEVDSTCLSGITINSFNWHLDR